MTFEYTVEDLQEGLKGPMQVLQRKRPKRPMLPPIGWVIFFAITISYYILMRILQSAPTAAPPQATQPAVALRGDPWMAIVPSALAALVVALLLLASGLGTAAARKLPLERRQQRLGIFVMGAVLVCCALVAIALSWLRSAQPTAWRPSHVILLLCVFAPWVLLLLVLIGWNAYYERNAGRRTFNLRADMRRPRTFELLTDGLHFDDGVSTSHYRWPYFIMAIENERSFSLVDEAEQVVVLPKRALANEAEVELVRALFNNYVPSCHFLVAPRGFPIAPAAAGESR